MLDLQIWKSPNWPNTKITRLMVHHETEIIPDNLWCEDRVTEYITSHQLH